MATAAACAKSKDVPSSEAARASAPASSAQGSRVPEAEERLRAFLEGSLETSPPTETNALMACVPDGQTDRYLTLAR
jgi:hypothetical protein